MWSLLKKSDVVGLFFWILFLGRFLFSFSCLCEPPCNMQFSRFSSLCQRVCLTAGMMWHYNRISEPIHVHCTHTSYKLSCVHSAYSIPNHHHYHQLNRQKTWIRCRTRIARRKSESQSHCIEWGSPPSYFQSCNLWFVRALSWKKPES